MQQMFSADGYIVNQAAAQTPFGRFSSTRNGCSWIAAYNVLKAVGYPLGWQTVRKEMEKGLYLGGAIGAHPIWLWLYLRSKGLRLQVTCGAKLATVRAAKAQAGILFYNTGKSLHFAAFVPVGGERIRLFNAVYGVQKHVTTLRRFAKEVAKPGPFLVFTLCVP